MLAIRIPPYDVHSLPDVQRCARMNPCSYTCVVESSQTGLKPQRMWWAGYDSDQAVGVHSVRRYKCISGLRAGATDRQYPVRQAGEAK